MHNEFSRISLAIQLNSIQQLHENLLLKMKWHANEPFFFSTLNSLDRNTQPKHTHTHTNTQPHTNRIKKKTNFRLENSINSN